MPCRVIFMLAPIALILHCIYALPFMPGSSEPVNTNITMAKSFGWPKANSTSHYECRESGALGAYVCNVANWNRGPDYGICRYFEDLTNCQNFPQELPQIKSFGPDVGVACSLYYGPDCKGYGPAQPEVKNPFQVYDGVTYMQWFHPGAWVKEHVESFRCALCGESSGGKMCNVDEH